MITWIQTFFMKHNKWLFSALLIVIIVTFVLTIGNQSFFGGQTGPTQADTRKYYGYNLNNPADMERIIRHGELSAMLNPDLGIQGPAVQQYALIRVAALGLANELGIDAPTTDQASAFLRSLPAFQSPETGAFDPESYAQYRDFISTRIPEGERTLARVLREDYRIAQVRESFAGPGYVIPEMAEQDYTQRQTDWEVHIAQRSYADFQPEVDPSEEELRAFYEEDPTRFEVPEQVRVSAVRFSGEQFADSVEAPSEADLQTYFNRFRFRYQPQPGEGETEAPEVTLESVRDRVIADFRRERARDRAQQASDQFLTALYDQQVDRKDPTFTQLVNQFGGRLEPVEPFSRNNPPRQFGIPAEIFRSMWIYTTGDRYYSDLAPTPDGAALLVFEEVIPAHVPEFAAISGQVENAWSAEMRRQRFAQAAQEWETALREALAEGNSFEEAAAELGFSVSTPDAFRGSDAPRELYQFQLFDELRSLDENELSPVIISQAGAATVYVRSKEAPEVDRTSEAFLSFLEEQQKAQRQNSSWAALGDWTNRTLSVVSPDLSTEG